MQAEKPLPTTIPKLPSSGQITRWIAKRKAEGATLRIENHEVDGALMSFQCAYDEDGVLYDWFPAEPADKEERAGQLKLAQGSRRSRLKAAAQRAGYDTIDKLAAAILDGRAIVTVPGSGEKAT